MKDEKKFKEEVGMVENANISPAYAAPSMMQPIMCCPYLMNMQCPMVHGQYMGYNNMPFGQTMPYSNVMPYSNMGYDQALPYSHSNYPSNISPYMNNVDVMGQYMDNMHY